MDSLHGQAVRGIMDTLLQSGLSHSIKQVKIVLWSNKARATTRVAVLEARAYRRPKRVMQIELGK